MGTLSNKAVIRAGEVLRRWYEFPMLVRADEFADALAVLKEHRRRWSSSPWPLTKITIGLRSMVKSWKLAGRVTQRLKRTDRIIQKLWRHDGMALSRMNDIGGCRVVLGSVDDVRQLEAAIRRRWGGYLNEKACRDYIARPKPTGYRAVHLIINKHGVPVEVQLRTSRQHAWATVVEHAENRSGVLLKDGRGDPETLEILRLLADAQAILDAGSSVPQPILERLASWYRLNGPPKV